jgi:peptidoglycan/LPS O-acetylase OafA/YrhL
MYLNYIHHFRGIAIIVIISGHCIRFFNWGSYPVIEKTFKAILLNGTVMFVFIAGFLFQHLYHKYTYKQYLINKLKNIIIPYSIISIPIIIYLVFIQKLGYWSFPNLNEKPYFFQIIWFYLTGHHLAPLWFIPMITIYYLLFPLFVFIDTNVKLYYFVLPIAIIISIIVHRPPSESNLTHVFLHFFSAYLLGMWFCHYKDRIFPVIKKMSLILIVVTVVVFFIEVLLYEHTGVIYVENMFYHDKEFININFIQKLLLSLLFINCLSKYENLNGFRGSKIVEIFATLSFGIYFVHYYFIEFLLKTRYHFQYELTGNPLYLMILVVTIGTASVVSLKLSKLILGNKSRYFVGC